MKLSRLGEAFAGRVQRRSARGAPAEASTEDPILQGVCFDSRRVQPGDLFCALPGTREDGVRFIADAIASGAAAVLHAGPSEQADRMEPFAREGLSVPSLVANDGESLPQLAGEVAARFWQQPGAEMWVAAVTGTNGKTTVVHLLEQALEAIGIPTTRIGTLGFHFRGRSRASRTTTPAADELHAWLAQARDDGARAAVLEASSHGLHQERLAGLPIDVAGWTNLTQDHLDYHADMRDYAQAKARLVHALSDQGLCFVPAGHALIAEVCAGARARCIRWALDSRQGELRGRSRTEAEGIVLEVEGAWGKASLKSPLVGRHNAENLLLAYGLLRTAGVQVEEAETALSQATGAPGRLERVAPQCERHLFVDYAHTPDALQRALAALREVYPQTRLGVVFGAGGDRDPSKREQMGRAAAEGSDWCLVTSDNPRSEDPMTIANAVARGVQSVGKEYSIEVDRREAIAQAVKATQRGEVLLVAGKGHEDYQEINGVRRPFDDRLEVEEVARCLV